MRAGAVFVARARELRDHRSPSVRATIWACVRDAWNSVPALFVARPRGSHRRAQSAERDLDARRYRLDIESRHTDRLAPGVMAVGDLDRSPGHSEHLS